MVEEGGGERAHDLNCTDTLDTLSVCDFSQKIFLDFFSSFFK